MKRLWCLLGGGAAVFSVVGGAEAADLPSRKAAPVEYVRICDAFAPGLALGHSIGRLGCFAAGCCYGKETHHWWGVTFTNHLANEITGTPLHVPLEPTQPFERLALPPKSTRSWRLPAIPTSWRHFSRIRRARE